MSDFEDFPYSREDAIRVIRDYQSFLTRMYLDPARRIEPPEGGWPQLATDLTRLRTLGKTDEVLLFIANLPCISGNEPDPYSDRPHCAASLKLHDWSRVLSPDSDLPLSVERADHNRGITEQIAHATCSEHTFGLISGSEGHIETWLLNTKLGAIQWVECAGQLHFKTPAAYVVAQELEGGNAEGGGVDSDHTIESLSVGGDSDDLQDQTSSDEAGGDEDLVMD
jgi:hypothetical protein